jgi:hypothetical protein
VLAGVFMLNNIGALQAVLPPATTSSSSSSSSSTCNNTSAAASSNSDAALVSWAQRLQGEADAWTEALARSECNKVTLHVLISTYGLNIVLIDGDLQ